MNEIYHPGPYGIFYRKSGTGPAVVLLHGFPASGILWRNIWDELSVSYTVIVPDLPGSGNSPLNKETDLSDMAEMVKAILDNEHIDKAVLAGHSMGGYVALAFARLYPARVAGLSLVHSTTDADDEDKKKTRRKSIELIQNGGKDLFISQMVPALFCPVFKHSHAMIVKHQIAQSSEIEAGSMINFYNAMIARPDSTDVLANAHFPLQWISGYDDNIIPLKKILGKCHTSGINFVSFYNNCGHMSMLEEPGKLETDLKDFINYSYCYHQDYHE